MCIDPPSISVTLRRNVRLSVITRVNTDKPISKHPPSLHGFGLKKNPGSEPENLPNSNFDSLSVNLF